MNKDYIELLQDENTGEFYEPYATIVCKTEEDMEFIKEAVDKQKPLKITKVLPVDIISESGNECHNCGNTLDISMNEYNCDYCHWCGQKLDWSEADE